jgi:Cu(I)/Ag(I) efflux system membrane fusion protein
MIALVAAAAAGGYWWGLHGAEDRGAKAGKGGPGEPARRILYYRNPMGLPDISPVPKKDPMGMDYIPVYEGEEPESTVKISVEKVQKLGVKTEAAAMRVITRTVRAVGTVQVDERRLHTVAPKFEGWIERLHVNATGQTVRRGQALMEVYSPELVSTQQEYVIAWSGLQSLRQASPEAQAGMRELAESTLQRLRNWDISEEQLQRLRKEGAARRLLTLRSPADGVVLEKAAVAGIRFMPGEALYQIGDLSALWLMAEVFEQDLGLAHPGQAARITVNAYPGRVFTGRVAFVYPTVNPQTRTARVRVDLPNPGGLLKPAMYGTVELEAAHDQRPVLAIPISAVLRSGTRELVLVERGEGLFEPRQVKLGLRSDNYAQVLEGVAEGEKVVVSANFLIDAESNLKAALSSFGGQGANPPGLPLSKEGSAGAAPTMHGGH